MTREYANRKYSQPVKCRNALLENFWVSLIGKVSLNHSHCAQLPFLIGADPVYMATSRIDYRSMATPIKRLLLRSIESRKHYYTYCLFASTYSTICFTFLAWYNF